MTDAEIVRMFCRRDERAIDECKKEYGKLCEAVAINVLHNRQDAEEALNDMYLSAWNTVHIKKPDKLLSYLLSLTRNISVSKLRYANADKRASAKTPVDELADVIPDLTDTESAYEARRLGELINSFLSSLPERDRRLFILRYYGNYKLSSAAKKLGISVAAAKMSLGRIKQQLKKYLERYGYKV